MPSSWVHNTYHFSLSVNITIESRWYVDMDPIPFQVQHIPELETELGECFFYNDI